MSGNVRSQRRETTWIKETYPNARAIKKHEWEKRVQEILSWIFPKG